MLFAHNPTTHATILQQAEHYDSFYLYGQREIIVAARQLKAHFPTVTFLYSAKNNPSEQIVRTLSAEGFGTDAASLTEAQQGARMGNPKSDIQYSAPGKTERDIATALPIATLIADSLNEVLRINRIAGEQGIVAEIGVRIHPDFAFDHGQVATPSKFGIEATQAFAAIPTWQALPNVRITGLHIHCRSQSLSQPDIQQYHQNVLDFAKTFQDALGTPLSFVNMGAGLGIPYAPADTALDIATIASTTNAAISAFHEAFPSTRIYIETGRYSVGNNGVYVSKVLDKKTCGDKTFVILANTLNGFLRPCLANVLEGINPCPPVAEPLYTGANSFPLFCLKATSTTEDTATETVNLVGNLCTATDLLAKDITLPVVDCGDLIVTSNAGSYAAVLSPMQFSQQVVPVQLFLTIDGTVIPA